MVPIAIIHASSPVKACVCLRWGSRAVVVVGPWWSVVVVAGHSVSRVVHWHATWGCLPVDHGCRVASHTCHWTPTIKGKCVWHGGDNCASGGRLYNFLYLKEPKKGGMKWQLIFKNFHRSLCKHSFHRLMLPWFLCAAWSHRHWSLRRQQVATPGGLPPPCMTPATPDQAPSWTANTHTLTHWVCNSTNILNTCYEFNSWNNEAASKMLTWCDPLM